MIVNDSRHDLSTFQSLKCILASLISTSTSVSLMHPLQVVKVRFQSHDGQSNQHNIVPKHQGVYSAIKQIVQDEGYQELYKGLSVTIVNAAIFFFLFFSLQVSGQQKISYEKRKKTLLMYKDPKKKHQTYEVFVASVQSGIGVVCITQPMWVLRTRMLLNTQKHINEGSNFISTVKQINQHHGIKGFYKGFSMNLLLSSNRALQMLAYQTSKTIYDRFKIPQTPFMEKNFICGGFAKIANVFIIYPLTTLRTRIIQNQFVKSNPNQPKYSNVIKIAIKTWQKQGINGFYKGMTANLLRGIPERHILLLLLDAERDLAPIIKKLLISFIQRLLIIDVNISHFSIQNKQKQSLQSIIPNVRGKLKIDNCVDFIRDSAIGRPSADTTKTGETLSSTSANAAKISSTFMPFIYLSADVNNCQQ